MRRVVDYVLEHVLTFLLIVGLTVPALVKSWLNRLSAKKAQQGGTDVA